MIVSKKLLATVIVTCLLIGACASLALNSVFIHGQVHNIANVYVGYETASGRGELVVGNLITNIGENQSRTRFSTNASYNAIGWISLGNATVAATLTQLTTEYARYGGTVVDSMYASHSAMNCSGKYTFTEEVYLTAAGCHWAESGDNTMYACAYLESGSATHWRSGDNITITWVLSFSY